MTVTGSGRGTSAAVADVLVRNGAKLVVADGKQETGAIRQQIGYGRLAMRHGI